MAALVTELVTVLASSQMAALVIEMVNVCGSSLMAALVTVLAGNTEEIQRKGISHKIRF
jgi:Mg-chelatase subunit ChlI